MAIPLTPDPATLLDLLAEQVRRRPHRVAVRGPREELDFQELARRAGALGAALRRAGAGPDTCVGLLAEPSVDLVVSVWGVLAAGAAYLPLSPEDPPQRLRALVGDDPRTVLLAPPHLAERAAEVAPRGGRVVTTADADPRPPVSPGRPRADQLAYVVHTSGSTGAPKGVMIEHRSIVAQLRWLAAAHGIGPGRVILAKTPLSFDAAQWEVLAPAVGATVVAGAPGLHRDAAAVVEAVARAGVTTLQCVPTLLTALLEQQGLARCTTLEQVFCGGEALTRELARRTAAALPGARLVNLYGPTECTINTSSQLVDPATLADAEQTIPLGRPTDRTAYHVLGEDGAPVGVGEVGELHVSGVQVARGYRGRPDLTAERFLPNPFSADPEHARLYRTGDLVVRHADGTVGFHGRRDNQVKVRGFRIELDEVRLAVEGHPWVRHAAVVVRERPGGHRGLTAFVEFNPKEAALMDQGHDGAHHRSKADRRQARAQLAAAGCRTDAELAGRPALALPGRTPSAAQRDRAFARKTYRFFDGPALTRADVLALLARRPAAAPARDVAELDVARLGVLLRGLGRFDSDERLLPKYGYASPGALYAVQLFLETVGITGLDDGLHYLHPARHQLVRVGPARGGGPTIRLHLTGRRRAIEPVYRDNVREVLEFEAGHLVGLLDELAAGHGLAVDAGHAEPAVLARLAPAPDDEYLASFALVPAGAPGPDTLDTYVQPIGDRIAGLPAGLHRHDGDQLVPVTDTTLRRSDVIAINQQVFERASLAVALVARSGPGWRHYVDLGRRMHALQAGDRVGLMSAGYSSKSGAPLPAARRLDAALAAAGRRCGASYVALGGPVSAAQRAHRGMREDAVHMKGPTELITDDLVTRLPRYMLPDTVVALDALPLTPSGKLDTRRLAELDEAAVAAAEPHVAPRTPTERRIAALWSATMGSATMGSATMGSATVGSATPGPATTGPTTPGSAAAPSVRADFFRAGGNSLTAVALVHRINAELGPELGVELPVQALFGHPTIERLAAAVEDRARPAPARLVELQPTGTLDPVVVWPGLGGYPMNLRRLAHRLRRDRPVLGVQAHGINPGETPHPTLAAMAAADVALIRGRQPAGPYRLWGYSFGARVAVEAARRLEAAGAEVAELVLIAPGAPPVAGGRSACHRDEGFRRILGSVFTGQLDGPAVRRCLRAAPDSAAFADAVAQVVPGLPAALIRRIVAIVETTFGMAVGPGRAVAAPVTVLRAAGDRPSPLEEPGWSLVPPAVLDVPAGHYALLGDRVEVLVAALDEALAAGVPGAGSSGAGLLSAGHPGTGIPGTELLGAGAGAR